MGFLSMNIINLIEVTIIICPSTVIVVVTTHSSTIPSLVIGA